jgi:hypothetical protein
MINLISNNSFSFFALFIIIVASLISFDFIFNIYEYYYIVYSKIGYIKNSNHNIIKFVNFNVFSILTHILLSIKYKFITLFLIYSHYY